MSRILQALKQLEARPGEAPVPPLPTAEPQDADAAASSLAPAPIPPVAIVEPAPVAGRQVTERIQPRRKPRKARRVEVPSTAAVEAAALATAEDVERLLAALVPGVIECWTPHAGVESLVLSAPPDFTHTPAQAQLVLQEFGPPIAAVTPAETVAASEVDLEVSALAETPTTSEVDLEFSAIQPRRAPQPEVTITRSPGERAETQAIEQQVRQVVRGPRAESVTRPSAWETTIHADLENATTTAAIQSLVERWQADRGVNKPSTLLVASLAQPRFAAEVAMRAAALLARTTEEPVLLIDADTEGAISRRLAIIGKPGLTELLSPQDAHGETIFPTATPRLHVLPRGRSAWPPARPPAAIPFLLNELANDYPWLIVVAGEADSPPVTALARACEGTYVVTPLGETSLALAEQRLAALQTAGARILGAIATE